MRNPIPFVLVLAGLTLASAPAAVTIDTVYVGDLRNPSDYRTGYGTVNYGYNIGKYEVTVNQYCAFLNAVGATDPYGLWDYGMQHYTLYGGGILRSGASGSYTYSVAGSSQRPVTYVTWFDAARFANWMQNGQPTGAQGAGTTESGSYSLNGAMSGVSVARNANSTYVLPSENEWYKAAFYTPTKKLGPGVYSLYPTFNNVQPNSRYGSTTDPNSANYYYDDGIDNGYNGGHAVNNSTNLPSANVFTDVGSFTLAKSFYGTYDQAGNVTEWNDTVVGANRGLRGSMYHWTDIWDRATARGSSDPTLTGVGLGFRIVVIPEPSALALLALGGVLLRRRHAR